MFSKLMT